MSLLLRGGLWAGVYLVLVLTPMVVLVVRPLPGGSGFWWDFSMAIGFASTTMMGVTFALTARFRHATEPFGIDVVYYAHRRIAWVALLFALLHPLLVFAGDPSLLEHLNPAVMPQQLIAAFASLFALLLLMGSSAWRQRLGIEYDRWRALHAILAVLTLTFAVLHIQLVGYYVDLAWKKWLWIVIPASWIGFLLYRRLIKPFAIMRRPYRIVDVRQERGQCWTLVFEPDGHSGLRFSPGQFVWLSLWHTPFALREHPFSLASSAEKPAGIEVTIKELGDFTRRIGMAKVGERAYMEGPYGIFTIDRMPAPGYVFIGGGIGVAPFMGILRTMADRRDPRPVLLFYAAKTWDGLTFREELAELEEKIDLKTVIVLEEPPPDWKGEKGLLTREVFERHLPVEKIRRVFFIDGPAPMMAAAEEILHELRVPGNDIHVEIYDLA